MSKSLCSLLIVIFLDSLGVSLFIPLATPLFISHSDILSASASSFERNFYYALSIGIYPLVSFFAFPILGILSDKIGRKRILLLCLLGTGIGYLFSSVAVVLSSALLIIIGRIISGFTAGSMSIAQAAIIDVCDDNKKSIYIGYVLLAASLGYLVGPIFAGVLSNSALISWVTITTPMNVTIVLSIINVILLMKYFSEVAKPSHSQKIDLLGSFKEVLSSFENDNLRYFALIFLLFQIGWATYFEFVGLFLYHKYDYTAYQIGLFIGMIGVGFVIAFSYLLRKLTERYSLKRIVFSGLMMMFICITGTVMIPIASFSWAFCLIAAMGLAITYSSMVTLFSNEASKEDQGKMMGITGSLSSLAFGVTAFISGMIANLGISLPLYWASLCLVIGIVVFWNKELN